MTWTDLSTWNAIDPQELIRVVRSKVTTDETQKSNSLCLRSKIKPVDLYGYLLGKFGEPNGMQSLLLRFPSEDYPAPDSGNLFHWDYEFSSGLTRISITGLTREIHIRVSQEVTNEEWLTLIMNLKKDFGIFAKQKSEAASRFEKWFVFANPFVALADVCEGLHENITDALEENFVFLPMGSDGTNNEEYQKQLKFAGERAERIYNDCLQLRVFTPILGEAFINMLTALLAKAEIKDDTEKWLKYRKASFHEKLENLQNDCIGFIGPLDQSSEAYKEFMRIRDKRNHILHANVLPEKFKLETVFFDGKAPLYPDAGDPFKAFWENYDAWVAPSDALEDYENAHLFFIEIQNRLRPQIRQEFESLLGVKFLGYNNSTKRFGKLFPDYVVHFTLESHSITYDDQID